MPVHTKKHFLCCYFLKKPFIMNHLNLLAKTGNFKPFKHKQMRWEIKPPTTAITLLDISNGFEFKFHRLVSLESLFYRNVSQFYVGAAIRKIVSIIFVVQKGKRNFVHRKARYTTHTIWNLKEQHEFNTLSRFFPLRKHLARYLCAIDN